MSALAIQTQSTGFDLRPKDMGEAMQIATMISSSQLAPTNFRGRPEDTLVAMMMGNEVGLNPMQAIQNIAVINGRPCIWGDALLALVQNHPSFGSIKETFDDKTMTATCTVKRKGGEPHTSTFSKADAEQAGLWNKNTWKQYPKRMLAMRARGFALRNQFADALLGLVTREEAMDMPVEKEVNPIQSEHEAIKQEDVNELPTYTDEQFKENMPKWKIMVEKGKNPKTIISMIRSSYVIPLNMETEILNLKGQ